MPLDPAAPRWPSMTVRQHRTLRACDLESGGKYASSSAPTPPQQQSSQQPPEPVAEPARQYTVPYPSVPPNSRDTDSLNMSQHPPPSSASYSAPLRLPLLAMCLVLIQTVLIITLRSKRKSSPTLQDRVPTMRTMILHLLSTAVIVVIVRKVETSMVCTRLVTITALEPCISTLSSI